MTHATKNKSNPTKSAHKKTPSKIPKYNYADFPPRLIAYFVDLLILALPYGIIVGIHFEGLTPSTAELRTQFFIQLGVVFFYFFIFTWLNKGRSLGQWIMKLEVKGKRHIKDKELTRPTLVQALIHSAGKFYFFVGIDLIIGLFLKWRKGKENYPRFCQILANTHVVHK
ncbi:hypothetical protein NEF87_003360 [Candidatus Lokiarchaeum ossiferum]|uniref:RDD domain-containing protein n=1 Tax=Candidatus Lokiarchaeum ossiferum TaxID=2951803 RepID=A0ABY6HUH6_9ARCH|nr:hypothetical protein NEF87_003360 [Candidatus Lokiarchaeum sp. B-35]